jgi:hypothetical protein
VAAMLVEIVPAESGSRVMPLMMSLRFMLELNYSFWKLKNVCKDKC